MGTNKVLIAFSTIVVKEVTRFMRIWVQTILPPVISMSLYFIVFGSLIGPRIGNLQGVSYIDYITPGIIMMSIINNAYANVVSSFFGAKFQRHIEEILVAPVPVIVILFGFVAGGVARGCIVGAVVTLVAFFFTDLSLHNFTITLAVVLMTSIVFALGGLINAIFAEKFDDIAIIPTFVLTPLIYLGGVFYSIDMLPKFWQTIAVFNPIFYMVNAFRYGMLGKSDIAVADAFLILEIFMVLLFFISFSLLKRGTGIKT